MTQLPERMRAVMLTGNGGFDCLVLRDDVSVPQPQVGEVLIRVAAAGINNTDINTRTAWYSKSVDSATEAGAAAGFTEAQPEDSGWTGEIPQFPRIQGADVCGYVAAVGASVDPVRIGQRVLVEPVFRAIGAGLGEAVYFGSERDGGFAEYATAPSVHAHQISSALSDAELASFPCAYSAAENMVSRTSLTRGERVLITGASGGVGSAAVQLAVRRGAEVIAVVGPDKAEAVCALGASQTIPRGTDLVEALGGESVDVVIDSVGGPQFEQLVAVLRRGGRYGVAGAIAGPIVALDLRTLYLKDLRLIGCTVLDHGVFANVIAYIERGEIKPLVAATFPLAEIVAAQREFLTKRHVGKFVLTI